MDKKENFSDFDLITPLRLVLLKKADPAAYNVILELQANIMEKVLKGICVKLYIIYTHVNMHV